MENVRLKVMLQPQRKVVCVRIFMAARRQLAKSSIRTVGRGSASPALSEDSKICYNHI